MRYIVGAYVCVPSFHGGNEQDDEVFYQRLRSFSEIRGFEIPFWGESEKSSIDKLLMDEPLVSWEHVVTTIPYLATASKKNPKVGLASTDESGRLMSIIKLKKAFFAIQRVNQRSGKNIFLGFSVASAPTNRENACQSICLVVH